MRPVTNGEFERLSHQAKTRIVLEDEFVFVMRYFDNTTNPVIDVTWEETGYFGLFTILNQRANLLSGIGLTFTQVQTYGRIVMPLDYVSGELIIRSKDAPAPALGRTFTPSHQYPGYLTADEVTCTKIRIVSDKGRLAAPDSVFDLGIRDGSNFQPQSLPNIQLDSVVFFVQKTDAVPYYKGQFDPNRRNVQPVRYFY